MQFTDEELEIIRKMVDDWGFEYGLKSKLEDVMVIAKKIGATSFVNLYKDLAKA